MFQGAPKLVAQLPADDDAACAFFVEWRTHVCLLARRRTYDANATTNYQIACPTHKPGGVWGPMTIFLMMYVDSSLILVDCGGL